MAEESTIIKLLSKRGIRWILFTHLIWSSFLCFGQSDESFRFSFSGKDEIGFSTVRDQWPIVNEGLTYGLTGEFELKPNYVTTKESFSFWLEVPEGNYLVKVLVDGNKEGAITTIKAESRRLMILNHETSKGDVDTLTFMVNIRSARINQNDSIKLKSREFAYLNWDENLTLEFGGERPCIKGVIIEKQENAPTIFLAGNSTVVDQEKEPWASWGQMFPVFLKPSIAVANFAESGESLKSFVRAGRLDKISSLIQPGDYLFMEFAHNDQKPGGNHVEPFTSYTEYLMKFVNLARQKGATPVLVTSTNRRKFDDEGNIVNTLEDYPEAMRVLAQKEGVDIIDLHAMSKELYESLGPEGSKKAFVHYPKGTFEWQPYDLADNTHFSTYGAWQLAKCVVKGIRATMPGLQEYLRTDLEKFNPGKPDDYASWSWPITPNGSVIKPDGN